MRREYSRTGLQRADLDSDPIAQFRKWFDQATRARSGIEPLDANAMTLATADRQGRPSARIVLLKGLDERGFVFFTNYESRKGCELEENPQAALVFHWADLERQVCVAGKVAKVPLEESDAYFNSRPRGSRLATWVSRQSQVVKDRGELEENLRQAEAQYSDPGVPRPPYWGGYVLSPARMEFWQGRPNRLHDRFQYTRADGNTWQIERLAP